MDDRVVCGSKGRNIGGVWKKKGWLEDDLYTFCVWVNDSFVRVYKH